MSDQYHHIEPSYISELEEKVKALTAERDEKKLADQLIEDMRRELRLALRRLHDFPVNATVDANQLAAVIGRVDAVFGGGVVDAPAPPLFAGEPEHCSLCSEPGHTHDEHWLLQFGFVEKLRLRVNELEKQVAVGVEWEETAEEQAREIDELKKQLGITHELESRLGVTAERVAQLRDIAERGHAPEEVLVAALRLAIRFYDLVRKAWDGSREDYDEIALDRDGLKAELRKYVPSDGVMHQLLGFYEAISEAGKLLEAYVGEQSGWQTEVDEQTKAWLALPAVVLARKAMKR